MNYSYYLSISTLKTRTANSRRAIDVCCGRADSHSFGGGGAAIPKVALNRTSDSRWLAFNDINVARGATFTLMKHFSLLRSIYINSVFLITYPLQSEDSEPSNEHSRYTNPQSLVAHQLRRSTRERHWRASITITSRRRRPRRWISSCRRSCQVLHLEVATSQGLAEPGVADELTNIEW